MQAIREAQITAISVDTFIRHNGTDIFKTEPEDRPICLEAQTEYGNLELVPDIQSAAPDDEAAWEEM